LERFGATADWAKNGVEAVTMVEASFAGERPAYDLVLMDMRMPELDGLAATRRIRAIEAANDVLHSLRIVALTANAFPEDRAAAKAAGVDAFLAKPFDGRHLGELLGQSAQRAVA
jgi:CheY-like chemotaxis protein